jgi:fructose-1-phosphate kinase PfkB-like protein
MAARSRPSRFRRANAGFCIASGSLATGLPNDCYAHFARAMRKRSACVIIDTSASHWSKRSEPEFF